MRRTTVVLLFCLIGLTSVLVPVDASPRGEFKYDLAFQTSSRNMTCWLGYYATQRIVNARCFKHTGRWRGQQDPGCQEDGIEYLFVMRSGRGRHEWGCTGGVPYSIADYSNPLPKLAMGRVVKADGFICIAKSSTSIRCASPSRHGFTARSRDYLLW